MESDIDNADDGPPAPSTGDLIRAKLKLGAHYARLAFAPAVALLALVVAVITNHNQADQVQHSEYATRLDSLGSALAETKGELESVKVAMARERSMREEERKKMDGRDARIIQNISSLQMKMKVAPTLSEQLRESHSANVAASAVVSAAASAPAAAPVAETGKQPAVGASTPVATDKKHAAPLPAPKNAENKSSAQVKALREAIEKFNRE